MTRTISDLRAELERRYRAQDWPILRQKVFARDGYRCVTCGRKDKLRCHHLTYKNLWHEPLSDLATQCVRCHRKGTYGWDTIRSDRTAVWWIHLLNGILDLLWHIVKMFAHAIVCLLRRSPRVPFFLLKCLAYVLALLPGLFLMLAVFTRDFLHLVMFTDHSGNKDGKT